MNLKTTNGKVIPEFKWNTNYFLDCTTVLYGASRSGKSTIIKHIMKILQPYIDQVLVVSPSEVSNRAYEGLVDSTLIHDRLYLADPNAKKKSDNNEEKCACRFLDRIFDRQVMLTDMYSRASDIVTIESLFKRLPSHIKDEIRSYSDKSEREKNRAIELINHKYTFDAGIRDSKISQIKERFKDMLLRIHQKYLKDNIKYIYKNHSDLSKDEMYALTYIDINPKILIIFDDCAADLKKVFKSESMKRYFYRGRHVKVTMLISCQNDKDIPPSLRTNVFVSIYTDKVNCLNGLLDKSNGHTSNKEMQEFINESAKLIFNIPHVKMAYVRDDPSGVGFYALKAQHPIKPFRFGSTALHELCDMVREDSKRLDKSNPFYKHYAI